MKRFMFKLMRFLVGSIVAVIGLVLVGSAWSLAVFACVLPVAVVWHVGEKLAGLL